jgi:hypothetical protein
MSLFRKKAQTHQKAKPHQKASGLPWIAQTTTLCSKGVRNTSQTYTSVSRRHIFEATEMLSQEIGTIARTPSIYNKIVLSAELASIAAISFVPDKERRVDIYQAAADAKTDPSLCSKNKNKDGTPDPPASIDDKVDPSQSRLVRIAKGVEKGTVFVRDGDFAVVASRSTPLLNGSNGPNGVLTNFDGQEQRINLFDTDDATTKNLLDKYLAFRDANKKVIFDLTLAQMAAAADDAQDDYITTVRILTEIQQSPHFDDMIGVVSFCQTWATREDAGGPQFSIESPTFQTRFFIKSLNYDLTMTKEESAAYVRTVKAHDARMAKYKGKFVHLDDLQESLTL